MFYRQVKELLGNIIITCIRQNKVVEREKGDNLVFRQFRWMGCQEVRILNSQRNVHISKGFGDAEDTS